MNTLRPVLVLVFVAAIGISFNSSEQEPASSKNLLQLPAKDFTPTYRNGKAIDAKKLSSVYSTSNWFEIGFPEITEEMTLALKHHKHVLKSRKFREGKKIGDVRVKAADFEEVIDLLIQREGFRPDDLHQYLDAHQVWGEKKKGNVLFTGYYTPVVKAKTRKTGKYKYPIYANPEGWIGPMPSRKEIEKEGALSGLDLELAWAANPIDISITQIIDQYMAYLSMMEEMNIDLSGDFILMAAELAFLKSKLLLIISPYLEQIHRSFWSLSTKIIRFKTFAKGNPKNER